MKVSFCLPVYNVENYIDLCIDSIELQGLDDYEVICVNDCSTDGSLDVLKRRAEKNPRIRIIENPENKGVCYSRNTALKAAYGDYIYYVDPDDMLTIGAASALYDKITEYGSDVMLANYRRVDEAYNNIDRMSGSLEVTEYPATGNDHNPLDETGRIMHSVWGGLFSRRFLLDNELFFKEGMIAQEDTLFYYELSVNVKAFYKMDAVCYLYRQRASSIMNSRSEQRSQAYYRSMVIMLETYLDYFSKDEYRSSDALKAKIWHSKQNIAACLAVCRDTSFVKKEYKYIKNKGYYPFTPRKGALKANESFVKRITKYLVALPPFFWLEHWLNKLVK